MQIETHADRRALAIAAARRFTELCRRAVSRRGRFSVVLSGGTTPLALYRSLAAAPFRDNIDWRQVHVFWGDERCVPPEHPDSNVCMARVALLDHVPLQSDQVHRMAGEIEPQAAADAYEACLRDFFQGTAARFDLVLLGMGRDGHTASLFPGSSAVEQEIKATQQRWVTANYVDQSASWRVTLTTLPINAAAEVIFLVAGKDKAETLRRVLTGPLQPRLLPAQLIRPSKGGLTWMLDTEAARLIR